MQHVRPANFLGLYARIQFVGVDSSETLIAEALKRADGTNLPVEFYVAGIQTDAEGATAAGIISAHEAASWLADLEQRAQAGAG